MAPAADEYAGLEEWVWSRLPASKRLAGRRRVMELLPLALDRWSDDMMATGEPDSPQFSTMTSGLRHDVRRIYADRRYGSIWIILLSSLIGELVKLLVRWWLSSSDHKQLFRTWQRRSDA
jgi:hypothetical protein